MIARAKCTFLIGHAFRKVSVFDIFAIQFSKALFYFVPIIIDVFDDKIANNDLHFHCFHLRRTQLLLNDHQTLARPSFHIWKRIWLTNGHSYWKGFGKLFSFHQSKQWSQKNRIDPLECFFVNDDQFGGSCDEFCDVIQRLSKVAHYKCVRNNSNNHRMSIRPHGHSF